MVTSGLSFEMKAQRNSFDKDSIVQFSKGLFKMASDHPDSCKLLSIHILESKYAKNDSVLAYANEALGDAYYYLQVLDSAELAYSKSLNAYIKINDIEGQSTQYNNIGLINYFKGNFGKALENYSSSLKLAEELNDKVSIARAHHNLGMVYGRWERFDQLFEHYTVALKIYEDLKNQEGIAAISNNMGVVYSRLEQYDKALTYYRKAYFAYKELGDRKNMASISTNLGCLFVYLKENHRAMEYFNEAVEYFTQSGDKIELISTYSSLGDAYKQVRNYDKAIQYYLLAEKENRTLDLLDAKKNNYYSLYEAYKEIGQFNKALEVYENFNKVNDSIFSAEKYARLVELEKKYHSEKMRREIAEVKAKEQKHEVLLWDLSFLFLFCAVLLSIGLYVIKMKERQRRQVMEQKLLRVQMNPHFIFNSLSALQCYILEDNSDEAIDYIADFSHLMRMVLQYSKEEMITLKKEKEILERYVSLQNRRFNNKVNFDLEIDENISIEKVLVPPMLAQPFVENSFEHARLEEREDGFIKVSFVKEKERLAIVIEDNGVGINNSQSAKRILGYKSMAMEITKERIRMMQRGKATKNDSIQVSDLSDYKLSGTRIMFWVPFLELG